MPWTDQITKIAPYSRTYFWVSSRIREAAKKPFSVARPLKKGSFFGFSKYHAVFYELFVKVLSTCGADRMSNAELDEECNRKKFHGF